MRYLRSSGSFFVAIVWVCFLVRGLFYCSFLPVWEGYDEWAHFAVIERMATDNELLVDRNEPVALDVEASMALAPEPWNSGKSFISEDEYWRLPAAERAERLRKLTAIPVSWAQRYDPAGALIYEAQQPPLYYWIFAFVYRLVATRPLLERVFLLRYLCVFVCSFAIPVIYLVARRASGSTLTAMFVITLVSALPGLMIDFTRVGNECLGILIYSWLTLLALPGGNDDFRVRRAIWTGVALGIGLLTKAYFLTAVPALGILYLSRMWRTTHRREWSVFAGFVFGIALLLAGWWYALNRMATGTWSGVQESVKLAHYTLPQYLAGAIQIQWRNALDSILVSHVWIGGTSFLSIRSWMYHLIFLVAAVGGVGVAAAMGRKPEGRKLLFPLLAIYGLFWLGQLYDVVLMYLARGANMSMGWYLYSVVGAELTLLVIGFQTLTPARFRAWTLATMVLSMAALDLYTVDFVSIPYYVGLTAHRPGSDALQAFHLVQLRGFGMGEVLNRLSAFKPFWLTPGSIASVWAVYICATLSLICAAFWMAWRSRNAEDSDGAF